MFDPLTEFLLGLILYGRKFHWPNLLYLLNNKEKLLPDFIQFYFAIVLYFQAL
jgi:hypothetical protein